MKNLTFTIQILAHGTLMHTLVVPARRCHQDTGALHRTDYYMPDYHATAEALPFQYKQAFKRNGEWERAWAALIPPLKLNLTRAKDNTAMATLYAHANWS